VSFIFNFNFSFIQSTAINFKSNQRCIYTLSFKLQRLPINALCLCFIAISIQICILHNQCSIPHFLVTFRRFHFHSDSMSPRPLSVRRHKDRKDNAAISRTVSYITRTMRPLPRSLSPSFCPSFLHHNASPFEHIQKQSTFGIRRAPSIVFKLAEYHLRDL